jgi:hypothetical protein
MTIIGINGSPRKNWNTADSIGFCGHVFSGTYELKNDLVSG